MTKDFLVRGPVRTPGQAWAHGFACVGFVRCRRRTSDSVKEAVPPIRWKV
jgi:hypothetical protein